MKIRATVTDGAATWDEEFEYDSPVKNPREYMITMLANFNSGLRPREKPRSLVRVVVVSESGLGAHDWEKTNLVTCGKVGRGTWDTARCRRCGVTGKRFGLGSAPERDRKYKAKKYQDCNWMRP